MSLSDVNFSGTSMPVDTFLRIGRCKMNGDQPDWDGPWLTCNGNNNGTDQPLKWPKTGGPKTTKDLVPVRVFSHGLSIQSSASNDIDRMGSFVVHSASIQVDPHFCSLPKIMSVMNTASGSADKYVNWQVFFFRMQDPQGGNKGASRSHHFFTITGSAASLVACQPMQCSGGGATDSMHFQLSTNRVLWIDHDDGNAYGEVAAGKEDITHCDSV